MASPAIPDSIPAAPPPAAPVETAPAPSINLGNLRESVASLLHREEAKPVVPPLAGQPHQAQPGIPPPPDPTAPPAEAAAPEPEAIVDPEFSTDELGDIPAAIIQPDAQPATPPLDAAEAIQADPAILQLIEANPPLKQLRKKNKGMPLIAVRGTVNRIHLALSTEKDGKGV